MVAMRLLKPNSSDTTGYINLNNELIEYVSSGSDGDIWSKAHGTNGAIYVDATVVAKSTDYCHVFKLFGVLKDTVLDQSLAEVVKTSLSLC